VLGALAAALGQFGFMSFIGRLWRIFTHGIMSTDLWWFPMSTHGLLAGRFGAMFGSLALVVMALTCVMAIATVASIAQGALIAAALTFFKEKKLPTFRQAWHRGVQACSSILLIKIIEHFSLFLLLILTVASVAVLPSGVLFFALIRGLILVVACMLGVAVSVLSIFSSVVSVRNDCAIMTALQQAWRVFSGHVLVSIELSSIFVLLNAFVVGAVCIASYVATLFGAILLVVGLTSADPLVTMFGAMISALIFVVCVAAISGFFNAYITSSWVACFVHMERSGISSRLVRARNHIFFR
jgi:hypothetical protein